MRIAVLGPLEVDGTESALGLRDRVVLATLALSPGSVQAADVLADALWADAPPASWGKIVQGCVVRLRKALGPRAIATAAGGYRLTVHGDDLDHVRFERLVHRAEEALAEGEGDRGTYLLEEALRLWRGTPFPELADWSPAQAEVEHLVELHESAREALVEAAIETGRGADAVAEAVRLVKEAPFRERRWGLLALAQYRAGRQQEALATLQRARSVLVEELGLDPGPQLSALGRSILEQDPSLAARPRLPDAAGWCPYPGLVAYDVGDAARFHGRTAEVAACLRRLEETGVLAVVGPSGIGKSSVVRAGVAAALEVEGDTVVVLTPGRRPSQALAGAHLRPGDVLVVDQLEEVLGPEVEEEDRSGFLASLLERVQSHRLVVSLRADRLGDLTSYAGWPDLIERGLVLLGPMAAAELRVAVEGPAHEAGLRVEPGLVDLLVTEVEGQPGALPLLSHVLRATWEHREGRVLTLDGYHRSGGVHHAVARTAEAAYRDLDPAGQEAVRDLMLRLVAPGPDGSPVATRLPVRTLPADVVHAAAVERLLSARLLGSDGETVVVAHEALVRAWPRLRSWLDDDVEGQRIMRHLAVSADSWAELGRPDSELYRGVRQARAAEWRDRSGARLTDVERAFLDASAALAQREQLATEARVRRERRLNQRLRLGLAAVAVLLAVAVVAGTQAYTAARRADEQALSADARRLGAESLRTQDLDRAMLLAAAGVGLQDSVETRSNLLASLERAPHLVTSARGGPIVTLAVDDADGEVATAATGLQLHDPRTLRAHAVPSLPSGAYVTASPDGRYLAYGVDQELTGGTGDPPAVLLLDRHGARASTQLGGVPTGRYASRDMGFSPNSRWFAATLADETGALPPEVAVWDLQHPAAPVAVVDPGDQGHHPVVSADGRTLYSVGSGALSLTALPSGKLVRQLGPDDLKVRDLGDALALAPDGRTIALASGSEVVLVDTRSLAPRAYLQARDEADSVVFSPDGHRVAAVGPRLLVWDLSSDDPQVLLDQAVEADKAAFSPDGSTLYSAATSGVVFAWDLDGDRSWLTTRFAPLTSLPAVVTRFSPDGRKVAYVFADPPALQVRDVASGALGPRIPLHQTERDYIDVAWSPDSRVLNATTGDSRVATWDAVTGRLLAQHRIDTDGARSVAPDGTPEGASIAFFSHDGRYLLVGSTTGRLHVLDARTLAPTRPPIVVPRPPGSTEPLAIARLEPSPDDHTAVARGVDVVDYVSGRTGGALRGAPSDAGVIYSPDGRRMFVVTSTGEVGLLDVAKGTWIAPLTATEPFPAYIVAFSPDGAQVAAIARGRVGRWDGRTGEFLGAVSVPDDGAVAFAAGGTGLMIAPGRGPVLTWDLRPATWLTAACRMAGRDLTPAEWNLYVPDRPYHRVCAT